MELFKANRQWAERPADERFNSLQELFDATYKYAQSAAEKQTAYALLRAEAKNDDVHLVGQAGNYAKLTHWAFGQLCARVGAPASYLRELPATLAVQNINHGLAKREATDVASLLFHQNGSLLLRAITSDKYERIWNYDVASRLLEMQDKGWKPANECSEAIATWSKGTKVSAPLYASDHDMFAFIANPNAVIREEGTNEPLFRGLIVENSEVGASALKLTRFLYRFMCGNHIIWGASEVMDISLRHVGSVRDRFNYYSAKLRKYAEESPSDTEAKIASARHTVIAATKEEVLDKLFGMRALNLSRKALEASYDACVPSQDGKANTVWGFVQGATRYSQTIPYTDERTRIDRAAGKIMQANF